VATVTISVNQGGGGGGGGGSNPGDGTTPIGNRITAKAIAIAEGGNPTITNKLTTLSGFEGFTFVNALLTSFTDHVPSTPARAFLVTIHGGEGQIPTDTISGSASPTSAGENPYQAHVAINDAATDNAVPSATFKVTKAALTGKPILIFNGFKAADGL
jgi:hypothetical protein